MSEYHFEMFDLMYALSFMSQVFVLPAFAFLENHPPGDFSILENKTTLLANLNKRNATVISFGKYNYEQGHRKTNYRLWQKSTKIYKVTYETGFEPYVLMFTSDVMHYPEMLLGWYYDKMSLFMEFACNGYTYYVLPDVYVVHQYHVLTSRTAVQYSTCSWAVKTAWFHILKDRYRFKDFPWKSRDKGFIKRQR